MSRENTITANIAKIQETIAHFETRKKTQVDQMLIDHLKAQKHDLYCKLSSN